MGDSLAPDEVACSVGLVTKESYTFGSPEQPFICENRQTLPEVTVDRKSVV